MKPCTPWMAGAVTAVLIAGCGGGASPTDTVKDYFRAFIDGDGDKACEFVTPDGREELIDAVSVDLPEVEDKSCPEVVEFVHDNVGSAALNTLADHLDEIEVRERTDGDTATVHFVGEKSSSRDITLRKVDGEWRISSGFFG